MTRSVIIASGMRTAIGDFGGALSGLRPSELGVAVAAEAIARAGIPATEIPVSYTHLTLPTILLV